MIEFRYIIIFIFCAAIASGFALTYFEKKAGKGLQRNILLAVIVIAVLDVLLVSIPVVNYSFTEKAPDINRTDDFYQTLKYKQTTMYLGFLENKGVFKCRDALTKSFYGSAIEDKNYRGEIYLVKGAGNVDSVDWTPNKITIKLSDVSEDILVLNQRNFPGWKVSKNGITRDVSKNTDLLAVPVDSNDKEIVFHYMPGSFLRGILIFILTAATSFLLVYRQKNSKRIKR